jgi:Protein of unknown function DUF262
VTRQTERPVERLHLHTTYQSARELVRQIQDSLLTADLPYQRGNVWTEDQRINLILSWLDGTPIPSLILNDRYTPAWQAASGPVRAGPGVAVIDGKQRLETAAMWFAGDLAVPASWFPQEDITSPTGTDDGWYVRYPDLAKAARADFALQKALLPVSTAKVATIAAEAQIYLRVNGAGTPQTAAELRRAAGITMKGIH